MAKTTFEQWMELQELERQKAILHRQVVETIDRTIVRVAAWSYQLEYDDNPERRAALAREMSQLVEDMAADGHRDS